MAKIVIAIKTIIKEFMIFPPFTVIALKTHQYLTLPDEELTLKCPYLNLQNEWVWLLKDCLASSVDGFLFVGPCKIQYFLRL